MRALNMARAAGLLLSAALLSACATVAGRPTTVLLSSEPSQAEAEVFSAYPERRSLGRCVTPCTLSFTANWPELYDYWVVFQKEGHIAVELRGGQGVATPEGNRLHAEMMSAEQALREVARQQAELDAVDLAACAEATPSAAAERADPVPCRQTPPTFPVGVDVPGHCDMRLSVNAEGRTQDIEATACSDPRFERASVRALARWLFLPAREGGEAVARHDVAVRISFRLE